MRFECVLTLKLDRLVEEELQLDIPLWMALAKALAVLVGLTVSLFQKRTAWIAAGVGSFVNAGLGMVAIAFTQDSQPIYPGLDRTSSGRLLGPGCFDPGVPGHCPHRRAAGRVEGRASNVIAFAGFEVIIEVLSDAHEETTTWDGGDPRCAGGV
jgi:hypothetical protein